MTHYFFLNLTKSLLYLHLAAVRQETPKVAPSFAAHRQIASSVVWHGRIMLCQNNLTHFSATMICTEPFHMSQRQSRLKNVLCFNQMI